MLPLNICQITQYFSTLNLLRFTFLILDSSCWEDFRGQDN